jgi:hypothetical protein
MKNPSFKAPSITSILKKISDDKALVLLNGIAVVDGDKHIPLKQLNLTTKQYYSRITGLINAGLIKRHKGKYSLTMLGHIVHDSYMTISKTLAYYWKLKAIESIEMPHGASPLNEEIAQLIDVLIDNRQIKDILMKSISSSAGNLETKNNSNNNVDA